jgi:hypothetical protein
MVEVVVAVAFTVLCHLVLKRRKARLDHYLLLRTAGDVYWQRWRDTSNANQRASLRQPSSRQSQPKQGESGSSKTCNCDFLIGIGPDENGRNTPVSIPDGYPVQNFSCSPLGLTA